MMIQQSLQQFYAQTLYVVMLSAEISSLRNFRDSRFSLSASPNGNESFPSMLDVNQTLTPTDALQTKNTVCYDDLGCISQFSFADPLLWPINLLPEDRGKIGTHFTLYTRENPNPQPPIRISADNPSQISATTINATRLTKFYTHGWFGDGYGDIDQSLIQALLTKDDFNVICVHWGAGASAFYFQASANIRLVGLEIALLVNTMVVELSFKAEDVHLIGHSLGAHASGYAGKKIPNLGRITGLDPAGPCFWRMPSHARLDNTDAQFVDAVHTNAGFIGISEPVGHIDFYPNGGQHQPGCKPSDWFNTWDPSAVLSYLNGCDHNRAVTLYSASLLATCQLVAYKCSDYDSFNKGKCASCGPDNTKCVPFGLEANNYPSRSRLDEKFYFKTAGRSPFCISQYLATIHLGKPPSDAQATIRGLLQLSVTGENASRTSSLPISVFEHGKDHRFLLEAPSSLGPIRKVHLHFSYIPSDFSNPICFLVICDKRLYVNNVTVSLLNSYPESNRIANTYSGCPAAAPLAVGSFFNMGFSVTNDCSSRRRLISRGPRELGSSSVKDGIEKHNTRERKY